MIEWKKFDAKNPPQEGKYLLYKTDGNIEGYYQYHSMLGYTWWDEKDKIVWGVTHYTEINSPE